MEQNEKKEKISQNLQDLVDLLKMLGFSKDDAVGVGLLVGHSDEKTDELIGFIIDRVESGNNPTHDDVFEKALLLAGAKIEKDGPKHYERLLGEVQELILQHDISYGEKLFRCILCFLFQCPDDEILKSVTVEWIDYEAVDEVRLAWDLPRLNCTFAFRESGYEWNIELGEKQDIGNEAFDAITSFDVGDEKVYAEKYANFYQKLKKFMEASASLAK